MNQPKPPVGRLAPSPTGALHLGHARTFLIAWLAARAGGGRMILRIEDLDATRARPWAIDQAIEDLRWMGLEWDEGPDVGGPHGPYVQSERIGLYRAALEELRRKESVYPCTCTRADIERAASAPHAGEGGPAYPGTCSARSAGDAQALGDRPYCWRFRVPDRAISWDDRFLGSVTLEPRREGDFVVARSNGSFAYQLAVVVDDATMGINQVIRGDDLIPSTPRQILLYEALNRPIPGFGHVPLVVDELGTRLAKRDGSIKIAAFRETNADPQWLVGLLAMSCGWADSLMLGPPGDWRDRFDLAEIPRRPWVLPRHLLPERPPPTGKP
ncbi:MAG: tRNA glutamyl-Q(34) synthetase GluQRS [Isosphaeraceae bacterium]